MPINERIEQILKVKKWQAQELGDKLGLDKSKISNRMTGKTQWSVAELEALSDVSGFALNWIIQGYGPEHENEVMEILQNASVPLVMEHHGSYSKGIKRIPFFDIEATGGHNGADVSPVASPTSTIDIGDLLRDSEAAIRMAGNSMMPGYPPGSVLGIIPKKSNSIVPGEVYVYEDVDGRHCKRMFYKNDDPASDTFICYSDTTTKFESGPRAGKLFYPPYEIKIKEITRMFSVVGVIKINSIGPIAYKQ